MQDQGMLMVVLALAGAVAGLTAFLLVRLLRPGASPGMQMGHYRNLTPVYPPGGHATVYRAVNARTSRQCALKVLKAENIADADTLKKFNDEAEILSRIKKQSPDAPVVRVYEWGSLPTPFGRMPFMEMEFVGGGNLKSYIEKHGRMSAEDAEKVVSQVLRALVALEQQKVVHRDLKPQNILLHDGRLDRIVVCDFGVAKQMDVAGQKTMGNYGTASYMSPEQCRSEPVTTATDIYALGVLWYEMLAGAPIFHDDNLFAVMRKHTDCDPTPLINQHVPAAYQSIICAMLEKDPAKRPDVTTIERTLSRQARELPAFKPPTVAVSPPKTQRQTVGAIAGAAVGLAVMFGGYLAFRSTGAPPPGGSTGITVEGTPRGARVLVNGQERGVIPVQIPLGPGRYTVAVEAPGFSSWSGAVEVPAGGRTVAVPVTLSTQSAPEISRPVAKPPQASLSPVQPAPPAAQVGTLVVTGNPASATVRVDNQVRGSSLPLTLSLAPGSHTIAVSAHYHQPYSRTVAVAAGSSSELPVNLQRAEAKRLTVTVSENDLPSWGTVKIDGEARGDAPVSLSKPAAGEHAIEVQKPGFPARVVKVTLDAAEEKRVRIDLTTGNAKVN